MRDCLIHMQWVVRQVKTILESMIFVIGKSISIQLRSLSSLMKIPGDLLKNN